MSEEELIKTGVSYANEHKNDIARQITDKSVYLPDPNPASVFMAGSPGAGKTEFSKSLIDIFEKTQESKIIRIDADDYRSILPGYDGSNSKNFQAAISIIVEKIHDITLKQGQSFILDGTFSKQHKAILNIERSISRKRRVFIFYVYQRPDIAWQFTQARELSEGRNIPKSFFIEQFLGAREVVNFIRKKYGSEVFMFIVKKNFKDNTVDKIEIIKEDQVIDDFLEKIYTKEELEQII